MQGHRGAVVMIEMKWEDVRDNKAVGGKQETRLKMKFFTNGWLQSPGTDAG